MPTTKTGTSPRTFLSINREGTVQIGTSAGSSVVVQEDNISLLDSSGHLVQLDGANNQIMLVHRDGTELIAMESGVVKVNGTAIQIGGGTIELGDGAAAATESYVLGDAFLTDLKGAIDDIVTGLAAVPYTAVDATAFSVALGLSLASGPPFLSTVVKGA